jgi:hypothetical protein
MYPKWYFTYHQYQSWMLSKNVNPYVSSWVN